MLSARQCRSIVQRSLSSAATRDKGTTTAAKNDKTRLIAATLVSLSVGFVLGQTYQNPDKNPDLVLPNGLPRTCCEHEPSPLTEGQKALPATFIKVCGRENVIIPPVSSGDESTLTLSSKLIPFLKGARLGQGTALCIVTPEKLGDVPFIVKQCLDNGCVVLPQGQNTGLTGGSVPRNQHDHRPVVVLSFRKLNRMFPIDNGERVVCLPGVGLADLQKYLDKHAPGRQAHSVLGSTFLNPTTAAGVAFGSGGTLLRQGPAYTERALYLRIDNNNKWKENRVELVDTLGIDYITSAESDSTIYAHNPDNDYDVTRDDRIKQANATDSLPARVDRWSRIVYQGFEKYMRYSTKDEIGRLPASDTTYAQRLCDTSNPTEVARYNADTRGPDCNRSEGKVVILATVHDTFAKPTEKQTLWISFDTLETALDFRRQVCLDNPKDLPVSVEYMDRDSFDVINEAGRVLGTTIRLVGPTSAVVRQLWNVKLYVEGLPFSFAPTIADKFLYIVNSVFPAVLPHTIMDMGKKYDHHVAMTVGEFGDGNLNRLLQRLDKFKNERNTDNNERVVVYTCKNDSEANRIGAFRFVAASAFRTWCVGKNVQGVSIDYALPKTAGRAPSLVGVYEPIKRMRYSHFGCNVVHEDLCWEPGVDVHEAKHAIKHIIEGKEYNGKLPAEHGHGTEYVAPPETQERWKKMDPLNVLNPGIGGLSYKYRYEDK